MQLAQHPLLINVFLALFSIQERTVGLTEMPWAKEHRPENAITLRFSPYFLAATTISGIMARKASQDVVFNRWFLILLACPLPVATGLRLSAADSRCHSRRKQGQSAKQHQAKTDYHTLWAPCCSDSAVYSKRRTALCG